MKIESLREVKNNFSEVIESLPETSPVVVTKNGRSAALLLPIDEDTDFETLILSNSQRFWKLFDRAASERRTPWKNYPILMTKRRGSGWPVGNVNNNRATEEC